VAIFFQHSINASTSIGIWKIEEPESFFLQKVPLKQTVTHPYKRLQHLAGRYLLPALFADFPLEEILIADTRKPFLNDEKYHFSISHCGNYAAAIASTENRVGVDIELVTPRLKLISPKFLAEAEKAYLKQWEHLSALHLEMITIIWSSKEAIFKWHGEGNLDFRKDMVINGVMVFQSDGWIKIPFLFKKDRTIPLKVMARPFGGLIAAYVVT
jgi:4'-phosphopantetheinyl transferase EntD